ncbi:MULTISPECIES: ATP-binding protein [unclassified Synechococcus]|uniref:ATP-binding protein n=1 Tax=unclassified Synechococcus TaxID=2626047 RepID=UPI001C2136D5|nr:MULTISPECIES: ATP-binding protein [unclassified Synechococcus]
MAPPLPETLSLLLQPNPLELRRCSDWLQATCQRLDVPAASSGKLDLCLNEVLANLIDHGGARASSCPVQLTLERVDGDEDGGEGGADRGLATLTISDAGAPFDPLSFSREPLPRTLQEAEPGGLGLLLVNRFMDECSYRREGDRNVLKLSIRWLKSP